MMASKGQRMPKGPGNKGPMVGPKSKTFNNKIFLYI